LGKEPVGETYVEEIHNVELPVQDPVNGPDGPLLKLWKK
jgi:uncharacterized protein YjlB